jgi:hypothetical protein
MTLNREVLEAEFLSHLKSGWARGAAEYGDASFSKPLLDTADEILEEIEDIAGWAFILWVQAKRRLRRVVDSIEAAEVTPGKRVEFRDVPIGATFIDRGERYVRLPLDLTHSRNAQNERGIYAVFSPSYPVQLPEDGAARADEAVSDAELAAIAKLQDDGS